MLHMEVELSALRGRLQEPPLVSTSLYMLYEKVDGAKCSAVTAAGATSSVHSTSAGQQLLDLRVSDT